MVVISKKKPLESEETTGEQQEWDNPQNPENTGDSRDTEQLVRQKTEAERRKNNLTEDNDQNK